MPEKQKELLIAITKEGKASAITYGAFIKKYRLPSSSSVQSALKGLLEKDFVTQEAGLIRFTTVSSDYGFKETTKRQGLWN